MHRPLLALALLGLAFAADAATQPAPDPGAAVDDGNGWLDDILGSLGDVMGTATRAERNNNPGNIRLGASWQGAVTGSDPAFVTFDSPASGFRALAKLLRNYQDIYGLNTVRKIISRYAPASENNTAAYIAAVAQAIGVQPDTPIDLGNQATLAALMRAIATHESGRYAWADADLYAGIAAA